MKRNTWVAGALLALVLAVPVLARGGSGNSSDTDSNRGGGRSENSSRGSSGSSSRSGSSRGGSSGSSNSGGGRSGSGSSDSGSRRDGPGRTGSERGGNSRADKGGSDQGGSGKSDTNKGGSDQGGSGTGTSRRNGPTDRGRDDTDLRPHRRLERDHGDRRDPHRGYRWGYPGYYGLFGGYDYYGGYGGLERREDDDRPFKGGDNVEIRVKPDNAQVYVNGLLYSNKGKAKFGLPSGPWKIELRAPGYLTQVIELNVEQGIRYTIERKLEKDQEQGPDGRPLKTEELNRTE